MNYPEFFQLWDSEKPDIECQTSGSTGRPDKIRLPKLQMLESAKRTIAFFGLDANSRLHSCISPQYIGGKMMAVRQRALGCTLTWETPASRPTLTAEGIEGRGSTDSRIDLLAVVPTQMLGWLDSGEALPPKAIIIGGGPIVEGLRRKIAASGLNAWETYGMTETASHIALRRVGSKESSFIPLPGIKVENDARGCLVIDIPGWKKITTTDLAEIATDGSFRICGRFDNIIITGGKKVNPEILESKIETEFATETMVVGEPDLKWGSKLVLLAERGDPEKIMAWCRQNLKPHEIPKEIRIQPIPHTSNGKKRRKI